MIDKLEEQLLKKTKRFYEQSPYDTREINENSYEYLNENLDLLLSNIADETDLVIDVGCGTGWISDYFKNMKGKNVVSLDISFTALSAAKVAHGLNVIQANNLFLPLKSNIAGLVISSGVIHHTPNAYKSFRELVRILKPGGIILAQIYAKKAAYFWFYKYFGGLLRKGVDIFEPIEYLYKIVLLPPFYLAGIIRSVILKRKWEKRNLKQLWNHFRDFLLTPHAAFFELQELKKWFLESNMEILKYERGGFGTHCFILRKDRKTGRR